MRLSFFRDNLTYIGPVTRLGTLVIPDHFSPISNKDGLKLGFISCEGQSVFCLPFLQRFKPRALGVYVVFFRRPWTPFFVRFTISLSLPDALPLGKTWLTKCQAHLLDCPPPNSGSLHCHGSFLMPLSRRFCCVLFCPAWLVVLSGKDGLNYCLLLFAINLKPYELHLHCNPECMLLTGLRKVVEKIGESSQ